MNRTILKLNNKGFTLVELLVVIAIIAILAVVGVTIFAGTQKTARDARRKADVDAMAAAYEKKYDGVAGTYSAIGASDFAGGTFPTDPGTFSYTNTLAGTSKTYTVCAQLENNNGNSLTAGDGVTFTSASGASATHFCKKNQQS